VVGVTYLLARFLVQRGRLAWWAAVYGLFPGLVVAVKRDLTEPLGYALVACALLVLERRPSRVLTAGLLFALAGLTREFLILFAVVAAVWVAVRVSARAAALMLLVSILPVVAYHVVLKLWIGSGYYEEKTTLVPFGGLVRWGFDHEVALQIVGVVVPGLVWVALAVWASVVRRLTLPLALVIVNVAFFVVWLPPDTYVNYLASARQSTGLALAAVLAAPSVLALEGFGRTTARVALLMLTPLWLMASFALASPF